MLRINRNYISLVLLNQLTCTATILSVVVFAGFVCAAQNTPAPTPADIFRQTRSSVVLIVGSATGDKIAQGSGFIVGKDKVVTNYHVIAGLSAAYVLFADGRTERVAGVVAADSDQDTAVLDVQTGTRPPLALGDELNLHEGESVLAIGAPRGLELSLTNGIISAFRNSEKKFLIQNTAPIAPGSSGGPLLDSRGRVVGLTTSLLADTPGVYFSIGIGAVKRLLKAVPTLSQSFAEWAAEKGAQPRLGADTVCSFITSKMMSALPTVPTSCFVKEGGPIQYELRVFSPTEVLEGKMRRAWSTGLFLTAQALFFDGALNSTCEFSYGDKDWYGCQLDVSDSYLSQHNFYYGLRLDKTTKDVMQIFPDPSSDAWYWAWWRFLLDGEEVSEPRFKSKGNAELRAESACKDYLEATPAVRLHVVSVTCSVLLVTDSSAYAVVDVPDLVWAMSFEFVVSLLESFGQEFAGSGYDGAVIFRSPWTTGASPTRVYHMYPLRSIAFSWEETNSGVREKFSAALDLAREREMGQIDRDVFSSASEAKDTLHLRNPAILRIIPVQNGYSLMDLTDGSEWSIPTEAQDRCNLNEGIEVSIFSVSGGKPPSLSGSARGKRRCPLNAVFVKGW
jgi:S1-C subfamily serine protease